MADNRNICEEIEIAIYSGTELTDEQKNHIENCEECRALLTQMTQLGNDLNALAVPGIREGEIADRVMENIKQQKLSKPFPKFKVTHHLGTAAAVAVILVAALIIKNPAETDSNKLSANDFDGAGIIVSSPEDAVFGTAYNDNGDEAENDGADDIVEEAPVMLKSTRPNTEAAAQNEEETSEEPMIMFKATMPENSADDMEDASSESVVAENSDAVLFADKNDKQTENYNYSIDYNTDGYPYGRGGGSSVQEIKIFAMDDFGSDLYENIEIANRIFFEISGISDYFKAEDFESNEEFLAFLEDFTFPVEN